MNLIRPDLVPEITSWAGDSHTIFDRFGIDIDQSGAAATDESASPASDQ
ncbi:hypothetical protein [Acidipropionibacterium virtanenii]|uniref:Uncharacterized protein n=1 Tax=Acidipropionibacterium virtanenii TaxID=2057246 RepID=A0A344UWC2_9ACTN|nr:hypothetical protein [Acidipropionibacterium virtanenii]AXE39570.1 hypothetical protein JS278_02431 [Acidipropionibacterium virtanenii]